VDGVWGTKSEGVGLIVREICFQAFQPMWSWKLKHQRYRRTDNMQSQDRAMHYSASCVDV